MRHARLIPKWMECIEDACSRVQDHVEETSRAVTCHAPRRGNAAIRRGIEESAPAKESILMPNRIARAAVVLSLALTAVLILRIIAIGKPGVFVILVLGLDGRASRHLETWTRCANRVGTTHNGYGVGASDWRRRAALCALNRDVEYGGRSRRRLRRPLAAYSPSRTRSPQRARRRRPGPRRCMHSRTGGATSTSIRNNAVSCADYG